ncbi:MAG: hypothetical protein TUN42_09715 [Dehalogenimonas sp.]
MPEIQEARKNVAAEAFREHVDQLIRVAEVFTLGIRAPTIEDLKANADQHIESVWMKDMYPAVNLFSSVEKRPEPLRNLHQYSLLFDALQAHTREKVQWSDFKRNWKINWNEGARLLAELKKGAQGQIDNFLAQQPVKSKELQDLIKTGELSKLADDTVSELAKNRADKFNSMEYSINSGEAGVFKLVRPNSHVVFFRLSDQTTAKNLQTICNTVLKNMTVAQEDIISNLKDSFAMIEKLRKMLEIELEPLRLRPLIIRTRCDLCPA